MYSSIMSRPAKRQRTELSLSDKVKLIKDHESTPKVSQRDLAEKYKVGKSTVGDILRKKDTYMEQFELNANSSKQRFNTNCKFFDINDVVWKWFNTARSKGIPISGPIIQEKALQFATQLNIPDFKASNGWLDRWRTRYSVSAFKVSGESASVDQTTVDQYRTRLPEIVNGYSPSNIFNCDETGLFYRALPDKTLGTKDQSCKGGKNAKERLTVMFACSATGEKLKPLVIGKSYNPRCFKNINKSTLPVTYFSNKKSWMTSNAFNDWIRTVNNTMRLQRRHILMFLDNATSHSHDLQLSNVTLKFLPANTTSVLQPLDQGIIRAFKANYRRLMITSLLAKIEQINSASELCREISVLDAIYWVSKAWNNTKESTIQKCFKLAGFPLQDELNTDDDNYDDDDIPLNQLANQLRLTPNMDPCFDDSIPTEDDSDDWEAHLISKHQTNVANSDDDDEAEQTQTRNLATEDTSKTKTDPRQNYRNFCATHTFFYDIRYGSQDRQGQVSEETVCYRQFFV